MAGRTVTEVQGTFSWTLLCTLSWFLTVVTALIKTEMLLGRVECHREGSTTAVSAQWGTEVLLCCRPGAKEEVQCGSDSSGEGFLFRSSHNQEATANSAPKIRFRPSAVGYC